MNKVLTIHTHCYKGTTQHKLLFERPPNTASMQVTESSQLCTCECIIDLIEVIPVILIVSLLVDNTTR